MGHYDITMLHNDLTHFYKPSAGVGLALRGSPDGCTLTLMKGGDFQDWLRNDLIVATASGDKTVASANRAYLHYLVDCWLLGVVPEKNAGDL